MPYISSEAVLGIVKGQVVRWYVRVPFQCNAEQRVEQVCAQW